MHVSIRTLKSQDGITIEVAPSESLGELRRRCSSLLPYSGNCKLLLRVRQLHSLSLPPVCTAVSVGSFLAVCLQGQTLSKKSVFGSLDLDPHDFLVRLNT